MTITASAATDQYRRDPVASGPAPAYPATGVRGEIKPHNAAGLRGGIEQLRASKATGKRLLLTYRTVSPSTPTNFEVLMASPTQVDRAVAGRLKPSGITTFYRVGSFTDVGVLRPIPLNQCGSRLGTYLEPTIRDTYAKFMARAHPGFSLPKRTSSHATGHDVLHEELAEFLQEIAEALGS